MSTPLLARPWWLPVLCAVLAAATHGAGLGAPFVFDDIDAIVDNPYLAAPFPDCLRAPDESPISGRPLVTLTLVLNHRVSGLAPWSYHLLNLLVHALVAALLADCLRLTVRHDPLAARLAGAGPALAVAVPFLWVVHPLNSDAVTYVIQRTELLMALAYMTTLWASLRAWEGGRPRLWIAVAVVACALGMLAKEVMVSAPLMVLLYDRAFRCDSWRACFQKRRVLYLGLAATWIILGILLSEPARSRSVGTHLGVSSLEYLTAQCAILLEYLKLSVWPHPLTLDHGESLARPGAAVAIGAVVLVGAFAGTVYAWLRGNAWGFVGAWFFLILGPTSSVLPIVSEPAAERRMYLPLMLVLATLVLGVERWLARRSLPPRTGAALLGVAVLVLGSMTIARNLEYSSETALWQDAVDKRPDNYRAWNNLGARRLEEGDRSAARAAIEKALEIAPDYPDAHISMGDLLAMEGRLAEAIARYRHGLELRRDHPAGLYKLSLVLSRSQQAEQIEEALRGFRKVLEQWPEHQESRFQMAYTLARRERISEAIALYREVLEARAARPPPDLVHLRLGEAIWQTGAQSVAEKEFLAAVELNPDNARAQCHLGTVAAGRNDHAAAIERFGRAIAANPDYEMAHRGLASAYLSTEELDRAEHHARQALRIKPGSAAAQKVLERILGARQ